MIVSKTLIRKRFGWISRDKSVFLCIAEMDELFKNLHSKTRVATQIKIELSDEKIVRAKKIYLRYTNPPLGFSKNSHLSYSLFEDKMFLSLDYDTAYFIRHQFVITERPKQFWVKLTVLKRKKIKCQQ